MIHSFTYVKRRRKPRYFVCDVDGIKTHFLVFQLKRQTSRYKVISNNRHELEDDATQEIDEVDAGTQEMMRLYQLYDVVLDEAEAR